MVHGTSLEMITLSSMCQNGLYTARGSKNSRIEHRELLFNSAAAMCAKKVLIRIYHLNNHKIKRERDKVCLEGQRQTDRQRLVDIIYRQSDRKRQVQIKTNWTQRASFQFGSSNVCKKKSWLVSTILINHKRKRERDTKCVWRDRDRWIGRD